MRVGYGLALRSVCGAGVGELEVLGDVVDRELPSTARRLDDQTAVARQADDAPRLPIGDVQFPVVVSGDNAVADTDPLAGGGGECLPIVDSPSGHAAVADRRVKG